MQSFSETTIPLGKGTGYLVKRKAKFAPLSGYCPGGCGLVQVLDDGTCPACRRVMTREHTWDSVIKRFDIIAQENMLALNRLIPDDYCYHLVKVPIMIGHKFYSVPLTKIQEFYSLEHQDREPKINGKDHRTLFFTHLIESCKVLKL